MHDWGRKADVSSTLDAWGRRKKAYQTRLKHTSWQGEGRRLHEGGTSSGGVGTGRGFQLQETLPSAHTLPHKSANRAAHQLATCVLRGKDVLWRHAVRPLKG